MLILEYHLQEILQGAKFMQYMGITDQTRGRDDWILANSFFILHDYCP